MYLPADGVALPATVFLGVPNYGSLSAMTAAALHCTKMPGSDTKQKLEFKSSSALTYNFNQLFATAISKRKTDGVTHFAMLHADVAPDPGFIDMLLGEMRAHNADVISCVIPIKDQLGKTTTGIGTPGKPEIVKRLTIREARRLPKTFTAADAGYPDSPLLINTGCWICDLRQPWVDQFPGFDIVNGLDRADPDNVIARFFSEDWWFGVWLHAHGVKVMATTAVGLDHLDGNTRYSNRFDWGLETDPGDGDKEVAEAIQRAKDQASGALELGPKCDDDGVVTADIAAKFRARYQGKRNAGQPIILPPDVKTEMPSPAPLPKKAVSREIVAVRYAESLAWVHNWLDDILVNHGPDLTYRIYDKGPDGGDTPNIGNLDWTYLHHIVTRWDKLADWTVFTQADPFPHLEGHDIAELLRPQDGFRVPFLRRCREWGDNGRLHWHEFPEHWKRQYEVGVIHPARLSLREWFADYIGVDIDELGALLYHPGAIFAVDRATIQRRPKAFYERLLANLSEGGHHCPEEAHYMERAWPYVFTTQRDS